MAFPKFQNQYKNHMTKKIFYVQSPTVCYVTPAKKNQLCTSSWNAILARFFGGLLVLNETLTWIFILLSWIQSKDTLISFLWKILSLAVDTSTI
jgi:hypothetical protein